MPRGFFALTKSEPPRPTTPRCGSCGLYRGCISPKMPVTGHGERKVLIVAEAPGREEDEQGVQLIGDAGQFLRRELDWLDVNLDRDCWKTNALACRPPKNRKPTDKEIEDCRPAVLNAIERLQPETIILLGESAVRSVVGHTWGASVGAIGSWVGWQIPDKTLNAWICPTWHPSYLNRMVGDNKQKDWLRVHQLWFRRHLEAAFQLRGQPFEELRDYQSQIEVETDVRRAAERIDWLIGKAAEDPTRFFAVDYETTCLKPDAGGEIVSCSVAWGSPRGPAGCMAFPVDGPTVAATGRLMASPVPKIVSNKQFEIRWTLARYGHGVRRIVWDTMHDAHLMDNRPGITGAKFQGYALLGEPVWDKAVEAYLQADDSYSQNRIRELPWPTLLEYNGMDSLMEMRIALRQSEILGIPIVGS